MSRARVPVAVVAGLLAVVTANLPATDAGAADEPVAAEASRPAEPVASPFAAETYLGLFDDAVLRGVQRPPDAVYDAFVAITGDADTDARIRDAAEARGYERRPIATAELQPVDGGLLQAPAAEAWTALRSAAGAAGVDLVLTSAYRDVDEQRELFLSRLGGRRSDAAIAEVLRSASPPGYSKHHTGYTVDVGQRDAGDAGFGSTAAYAWLAADDFAAARRFGFVPSYPEGGADMGPDPEPWEFVWVGRGRLACAVAGPAAGPDGFCDLAGSVRADDIGWLADLGVTVGCAPGRYCPDDPILRGEAASMLWRLHGAPPVDGAAPFADVYPDDVFAPAVAWLWRLGVIDGTSPTTFSPLEPLSPADALALLVRLDSVGAGPVTGLKGRVPDVAAAAVTVGDVGAALDRAEFASVLRATSAD